MSIKRTGGRKPTMGNWRASIWPRANMQYVNVVISMGICIWMHTQIHPTASPFGDTRALATCALASTLPPAARFPARLLHTFLHFSPRYFREYRAMRQQHIDAPDSYFLFDAGQSRTFNVVRTRFSELLENERRHQN